MFSVRQSSMAGGIVLPEHRQRSRRASAGYTEWWGEWWDSRASVSHLWHCSCQFQRSLQRTVKKEVPLANKVKTVGFGRRYDGPRMYGANNRTVMTNYDSINVYCLWLNCGLLYLRTRMCVDVLSVCRCFVGVSLYTARCLLLGTIHRNQLG